MHLFILATATECNKSRDEMLWAHRQTQAMCIVKKRSAHPSGVLHSSISGVPPCSITCRTRDSSEDGEHSEHSPTSLSSSWRRWHQRRLQEPHRRLPLQSPMHPGFLFLPHRSRVIVMPSPSCSHCSRLRIAWHVHRLAHTGRLRFVSLQHGNSGSTNLSADQWRT